MPDSYSLTGSKTPIDSDMEVYAMCQEGVRAFVEKLRTEDLSRFAKGRGCPIVQGFGVRKKAGKAACELFEETCSECGKPFPIVTRVLDSEAYNLPDAAVYQGLCFDSPAVALGWVKSNAEDPPNRDIRRRWQGLMWYVYDVAFVDVVNGKVKEFCPEEDWGIGEPPPELSDIVLHLQEPLKQCRREGRIPVGHCSRDTEDALVPIVSPVFREYEYEFDNGGTHKVKTGFWCGFQLDLLYRREKDESSIGIEVKVTEDWEHPINQPLKNLVHRNAVLGIRVPSEKDRLDRQTRALATRAESMLEATGRAAFIYVSRDSGNNRYASRATKPVQGSRVTNETGAGEVSESITPRRPTSPTSGQQAVVGTQLTTSDLYHDPNCYWAKKMIRNGTAMWFDSAEEARQHGRKPCSFCGGRLPK